MNAKQISIKVWFLGLFAYVLGALFCADPLNAQQPGGTFRSIDFPGSINSAALGINDRGDIVGQYFLPGGGGPLGQGPHGYLMRKGQDFTSIDVPSALGTGTIAGGINSAGLIVGSYIGSDFNVHGFLLNDGVFTTIDFPGAAGFTAATDINSEGEIVGFYFDRSGASHGFHLRDGAYTSFDPPGSIFTGGPQNNSAGDIVGYYETADGKTHVYLLTEGAFSTIDPLGPAPMFQITAPGINDRGQIAGYYQGSDGNNHGFVFTNGVFSTDDFPGAFNTCNLNINSRGDIIGFYQREDGKFHGFLLTGFHKTRDAEE